VDWCCLRPCCFCPPPSFQYLFHPCCCVCVQVFLCSLFAPVCLDRPVWPCRSLCEAVKSGCVDRMLKYGFPWPDMLRCDQFPTGDDLCIGLRTDHHHGIVVSNCRFFATLHCPCDDFCRTSHVQLEGIARYMLCSPRCFVYPSVINVTISWKNYYYYY